MNILILDTETISTAKPFCYEIGFIIYNHTEKREIIKEDFIIKKVWENRELFATAYYTEKRPIYTSLLRQRKIAAKPIGYIMQYIKRLINKYDIHYIFAYNSPFDKRVIEFNCNWYKVQNPFENLKFIDIRGHAINFIIAPQIQQFKNFCEKFELFADTNNYSTSAETLYKYITNNPLFTEAHQALNDCEIELDILLKALENTHAELQTNYEFPHILKRPKEINIYKDHQKIQTLENVTLMRRDKNNIRFYS